MKLAPLALCGLLAASTGLQAGDDVLRHDLNTLSLQKLGTYESGLIDEAAAEIVAYDSFSKRLYVSNANDQSVDVISIRNPRFPRKLFSIDITPFGEPNSVAVYNGIVAVAAAADEAGVAGQVVLFNRHGQLLKQLTVGFLPDMLIFSADGSKLVVANEGEPSDDYTVDPEGSISIITMEYPVEKMTQANVVNAGFTAFNGASFTNDVRIFGPGATVAQDLEPEYVAISKDSSTAYVAMQENNALAVVDLINGQVLDVIGLGTKDHNTIQTAMDASDRDDAINIRPWPTKGFYMPDSIAAYEYEGQTFIVTANEGDARDYDGYSEEERVKDLNLDSSITDAYPSIQDDDQLGRLKTTSANGDLDGDGDVDQIYSYGARSFSIWNGATGAIVYDSGSDFERITAAVSTELFNVGDNRSDDKGPEPEALTLGTIADNTYAFIGLERTGGIMVYDITNPWAPHFIEYVNNTILGGDADAGTAGDVAPEGLVFIAAKDSPNRKPLLVVANEVSGTTTVYQINTKKRKH